MANYSEDEYLMISGIQHFFFCRRQWALIHIENQWADNGLTTDGELFHSHAHDENASEIRNGVLIVHGMHIASKELGVSGVCDVVEFHPSENGIHLRNRKGLWQPLPIEYKRGRKDNSGGDKAQLCAEAMCLEEMLCCNIPEGILFWGEKHRREPVALTEDLRQSVRNAFSEMHQDYDRGYTPKVKEKRGCASCSLRQICLPEITKIPSAHTYIEQNLHES